MVRIMFGDRTYFLLEQDQVYFHLTWHLKFRYHVGISLTGNLLVDIKKKLIDINLKVAFF